DHVARLVVNVHVHVLRDDVDLGVLEDRLAETVGKDCAECRGPIKSREDLEDRVLPCLHLSVHLDEGHSPFPSTTSKKNLSVARRAGSIATGPKPSRELLPVPLPPGGIHANLLDRLLNSSIHLRSLAGPEEQVHVL